MSAPVVVVGAGLTGLALALGLQHRGIGVRVVERANRRSRPGAALSVDRALLERVTGRPADRLPILIESQYDFVAWSDLHRWLLDEAAAAGLPVEWGREVTDAQLHAPASVGMADGGRQPASVVVGADGVKSAMRRLVEPQRAVTKPAGYIVWRGLVPEGDLPAGTVLPQPGHTFDVLWQQGHALGAYAVPGRDGGTAPGARRLAFAWCDSRVPKLDAPHGGSRGGPTDTIGPANIGSRLLDELASLATSLWPAPWDVTIAHAMRTRTAFGTPIAEHHPRRLVRGSLALIGDAAHATTPMTGAGLHHGLLDALALAEAIARHGPSPRALADYETHRLAPARRLVREGRALALDLGHAVGG